MQKLIYLKCHFVYIHIGSLWCGSVFSPSFSFFFIQLQLIKCCVNSMQGMWDGIDWCEIANWSIENFQETVYWLVESQMLNNVFLAFSPLCLLFGGRIFNVIYRLYMQWQPKSILFTNNKSLSNGPFFLFEKLFAWNWWSDREIFFYNHVHWA